MNLFEEFNLYEGLWDTTTLTEEKTFRSEYAKLCSTPEGREKLKAMSLEDRYALIKADQEADPVQKEINTFNDFEFEYGGFSSEWYEDHFDPGSWHGHYQTGGSYQYPDFTYTVAPSEVFDTLNDIILPKYADKVKPNELLTTYLQLEKAWSESNNENEAELGEAMDLYLAENLDAFVDLFMEQLSEYYQDDAYKWAEENLDVLEDDYY